MDKELPYLPTYKKFAGSVWENRKTKVPDAFAVRYLGDTFDLKSTN
jgi:hypothetical protein